MKTNRRQFLTTAATTTTALAAGGLGLLSTGRAGEPPRQTYRAAVIGRTGGGDYGHGYERIFAGLDNVTVEAIADENPAGLKPAADRAGAKRQYRDYREMLDREKPDLVSIAPRLPDCHPPMALAAIEVCRGIFMEKPFTETPAEADTILAAAAKRNVKIQLAHNRRWTSDFVKARALVAGGFLGEVRAIRCQGKQDARVGGEDMIVLGVHDFDFFRFCFGDPRWCQASVTVGGRDITRADVRNGREPILVAGDTIHALFAFPKSVMLHWSSVKTDGAWGDRRGRWGFEILGTQRVLAYQDGFGFGYLDSPHLAHTDERAKWLALPEPKDFDWPEHARHPIQSLVRAIEQDVEPLCSGTDGRWTVEMVAAVYESQRTRARVPFPLADRTNPLLRFQA